MVGAQHLGVPRGGAFRYAGATAMAAFPDFGGSPALTALELAFLEFLPRIRACKRTIASSCFSREAISPWIERCAAPLPSCFVAPRIPRGSLASLAPAPRAFAMRALTLSILVLYFSRSSAVSLPVLDTSNRPNCSLNGRTSSHVSFCPHSSTPKSAQATCLSHSVRKRVSRDAGVEGRAATHSSACPRHIRARPLLVCPCRAP